MLPRKKLKIVIEKLRLLRKKKIKQRYNKIEIVKKKLKISYDKNQGFQEKN